MTFPPAATPRPRPPVTASRRLFAWARRWRNQKRQRAFLMGISLLVLFYSGAVLCEIIWTGDIGVRCFFGSRLKEDVPLSYRWDSDRPRLGDTLLTIDGSKIASYSNYIQAMRSIGAKVDQEVK